MVHISFEGWANHLVLATVHTAMFCGYLFRGYFASDCGGRRCARSVEEFSSFSILLSRPEEFLKFSLVFVLLPLPTPKFKI